jgi:hypothetical protein
MTSRYGQYVLHHFTNGVFLRLAHPPDLHQAMNSLHQKRLDFGSKRPVEIDDLIDGIAERPR